jgi:hypothetical protein
MEPNLQSTVAALADFNDRVFHALIDATYEASRITSGPLAWIDAAFERPLRSLDFGRPKLAAVRQLRASREGQ